MSHETALPHTIHLKTIHPPSCAALALTESIHVSNVMYLMSVYFHRKKSIVFQLGAWLCKHETALPHTIHLETIWSSSLCCSGTTESYTVVCHCTWCQCFHHKSQLCFNWGAWLCKHETALPHTIIGDHRPPVCCSGTHRIIHVVMSLYLMWVYSITRINCVELDAWLCKHEDCSPHTIHLETISPQFSSSGTHRINTSSNVTVPDVSVFITKESMCFNWCDYVSWDCSPPHNSFETIHPQLCCSGTHRINTLRNVTVPDVSVIPSQGVNCVEIGWLIM